VSYYALFEGWLLLSQPPGCRGDPTSFDTEPPVRDLSRWSGLFPSRRRSLAPAVSRRPGRAAIRSLTGFSKRCAPAPDQRSTDRAPQRARCTSMHFGENQLSPGSFGISPLPTAPLTALQRGTVRASTRGYPRFTLAMGSSPGFGSRPTDPTPFSDSLSLRLQPSRPQPAGRMNSPVHSSIGTPSGRAELPPRSPLRPPVSRRFQGLFHSPRRGPFHRSLTVLSAIGRRTCLALGRGRPPFPRDSSCPAVLSVPTRGPPASATGLSPSLAAHPRAFACRGLAHSVTPLAQDP